VAGGGLWADVTGHVRNLADPGGGGGGPSLASLSAAIRTGCVVASRSLGTGSWVACTAAGAAAGGAAAATADVVATAAAAAASTVSELKVSAVLAAVASCASSASRVGVCFVGLRTAGVGAMLPFCCCCCCECWDLRVAISRLASSSSFRSSAALSDSLAFSDVDLSSASYLSE
jgi:hypothetical protein